MEDLVEVVGKDIAAQPVGQGGKGQHRHKEADRPLSILFGHM